MKKDLMTTRLCGIIVFLSILAAWAGAATSTPEPASLPLRSRWLSMRAQLPTSTEERQFKLLSVTVRGVDLTFIREPSGAI